MSCFELLRKNGLGNEIDDHPEWKSVVTKNLAGTSSVLSMKEGSPARENAIYAQLIEENNNMYNKLESIDSNVNVKSLKNDRSDWMEMNRRKNEQIKVLEDKIRKL